MPDINLNPFYSLAQQINNNNQDFNESKIVGNSLFDSKINNDLLPVKDQSFYQSQQQPDEVSVLQQYVLDLVAAGKSQDEVTSEIEQYYATLTGKYDEEILKLQD